MNTFRRSKALLVAFVLLGFLLAAQVQSPRQIAAVPKEASRERVAGTIARLEEEQRSLKETIGRLREELAAQQKLGLARSESLREINSELEKQRLAAGLLPLKGQGITVTLDDSSRAVGAGGDPASYLVHDYELRDVINLLWSSGAEAVAVNDERLASGTSIYCVGSTILVNNTRLSPPYEIRAIGDAVALEDRLRNPANLAKLKSRARLYGIQFRVASSKEVTLPAYSSGFSLRYTSPAKSGG